jgi:hypothetical protein
MINEEKIKPTVEIAPFGIFSPAVSVQHVDSFDGDLIQQQASLVSTKVADWNTIGDISSAVSVYTSPATKVYTEGYSFHIYLQTEFSVMNTTVSQEDIDGIFDQVEEASLQQAIEKAIWDILDASPTKQTISPTALAVKDAFALAEGTFGNKSFGEKGLVHAPRGVVSLYRGKFLDDLLLTYAGTPIIAGSGYPSNGNKVYATGPITVRIALPDASLELDRLNNTLHAYRDFPVVVSILDGPFEVLLDVKNIFGETYVRPTPEPGTGEGGDGSGTETPAP